MQELVSELIQPQGGGFNTLRMGRGEPGLPQAFTWRGRAYTILHELQAWKESSPEGGHTGGELYLRRHYYKLRMSDGTNWTVYFLRQTPRTGQSRHRWYLYSVETPIDLVFEGTLTS
ncbi:MAG: DUF6504 family protein [Planctomycetota bacterium]